MGRISNISLAPSPNNALAPLFEAITNAIQAIEDQFGVDHIAKGRIEVEVLRPSPDHAKPSGFTIRDNGIGFNDANLDSFFTSDSRYKLARGGKGVGRFLWLKVFQKAHVSSHYEADGFKQVSFDFVLSEVAQIRNLKRSDSSGPTGTLVTLDPYHADFAVHCPSKPSTIRNKILGHFLSYFVNMHAPRVLVYDSGSQSDLFDLFSEVVADDTEFNFDISHDDVLETFSMHAFLLPKEFSDDEKGYNALYYGAHNRTVERHEIDQAIGLQRVDGEHVFFGFIESPFLDRVVNQERTRFSWPSGFFDELHKKAIDLTKDFLSEPIKKIRQRQTETVSLIRNEHLRFLRIAENPQEFANSLPLSIQRPEDIYLEMSRASLRQYNRTKHSFAQAKDKRLPNFDQKAQEFAAELKSESISSLAEYVLKRKLILDVFEERLKFRAIEEETYYFEEAVHEIICPLRTTKDGLGYDDHNLWIIDDNLAFYSYFASDKTLRSTTGGADASSKEPDLAIFDLGLGFNRAGSLEPITIIEFKKPGRDDYTLTKNPFVQIREYVTRLRAAGVARAVDGREVRRIEPETPFMGYIIADIERSLMNMMDQFGPFHRKAGHGSFYKWDEGYKIFIEVSSYSEVLKGAKARHQAFFEKLGVSP